LQVESFIIWYIQFVYFRHIIFIQLGFLLSSFLFYKWKEENLKSIHISAFCSTKQYSREEVSTHKTKENGIWVTYKNIVYDITEFIDKHPGGDKILLAAGGPVEPYWSLYAVHKDNKEVMDLLKQYEIGILIVDSNIKVHT